MHSKDPGISMCWFFFILISHVVAATLVSEIAPKNVVLSVGFSVLRCRYVAV